MAEANDDNKYDRQNQDEYARLLIEDFENKLEDVVRKEEQSKDTFEVTIGNTVKRVLAKDDSNNFEWSFYVRTRQKDAIKSVKIMLHPTFQPPWVQYNQPDILNDDGEYYQWGVTRRGWGEFKIRVEITLHGGNDFHNFTHQLNLSKTVEATHTLPTPAHQKIQVKRMEDVEYHEMHGVAAKAGWKAPVLEIECDEDARPGYDTMKAHEYEDDPRTLREKVKLFASLLKKSTHAMAYTGAGISTASGIDDYATKAKDSKMKVGRKKVRDAFDAEPSLGHRVLTQLWRENHLKHWVQQNHDGLPQKAGFPQHEINEIHGAWYDPSNPVVPMSGSLRDDLCSWMCDWKKMSDLCIAMGTSLCGMSADDCVVRPSRRYKELGQGYGGIIVGLQRTQYDSICSLRIFAKIDMVMALLADEMKIIIPPLVDYTPDIPEGAEIGPHQYRVPYDKYGQLADEYTIWDLRENQKVRVCSGPGKGFKGKMNQKTRRDFYSVTFPMMREGDKRHGKGFCNYALGTWWIETATKGLWKTLPFVNINARQA